MTQATPSANSKPSLKQCNNCRQRFEKTTFPPGRAHCRKCYLEKAAFSVWKSKLKHEYDITPEIYDMMYEDQADRCHFCNAHRASRGKEGLVIDHDTVSGFVRGLLCRSCNANWVDEYNKLPKEFQDSPRTNAYLLRGKTGDYIKSIKQRLASPPGSQ